MLDAGSWIINSCRLQVDFLRRKLTMQLPLADWLLKPQRYCLTLRTPSAPAPTNNSYLTVCNLEVDLGPGRRDEDLATELGVVAEIGASLGIDRAEFFRIVESVYDVWQAVDPPRLTIVEE
ncbi:hypothetical protein Trco_004993 [Trichoderma cornu-damae]|uniref:Uncharacterized protein n=1 Tax=Trichoderma cornu-damae TaxID=654480 RepID=A0A9P8QGQ1_9HYPO|nr:hypothetical protein Trco_004993 [Trichoderma cornu-damae]